MKAILVIDMPQSCKECPMRLSGEPNEWCWVLKHGLDDIESKSDWCPLKPMPKEKQICMDMDEIIWDDDIYNLGYNKCLHDILGEENE